MNTFLPYPDFEKTAKCLDMRRLLKQRVEVYQILLNLSGIKSIFPHHPINKMWKNSEGLLAEYGIIICDECLNRGYKDTLMDKIANFACLSTKKPIWWDNSEIYKCHRQSLLFKNLAWYSQFGWTEQSIYGYIWPINE